MVPVLTKWPKHKYMSYHFSFMYWSVIGLYTAFASETLTRIPEAPFFGMMGVATFSIMITASWYFRRRKEQWNQQFNQL